MVQTISVTILDPLWDKQGKHPLFLTEWYSNKAYVCPAPPRFQGLKLFLFFCVCGWAHFCLFSFYLKIVFAFSLFSCLVFISDFNYFFYLTRKELWHRLVSTCLYPPLCWHYYNDNYGMFLIYFLFSIVSFKKESVRDDKENVCEDLLLLARLTITTPSHFLFLPSPNFHYNWEF